jgi:hypothetical protein
MPLLVVLHVISEPTKLDMQLGSIALSSAACGSQSPTVLMCITLSAETARRRRPSSSTATSLPRTTEVAVELTLVVPDTEPDVVTLVVALEVPESDGVEVIGADVPLDDAVLVCVL